MSTSEGKHGIQWTSKMQLDDLDVADDLDFLSEKRFSDATQHATITLDGEALEDLKSFTYLGSIIDEHGGSDANMKARIGKARTAYLQLKNIRDSKQLSTIQHQISNSNNNDETLKQIQNDHKTISNIMRNV
ncbi:unnamed protein product [Schistosoma margrebowiei]|uniref:Uncharacterized protein n=1 Tax=Schistosoma margrebowiei TaxID=48269 RepID=A0A183M2E1_9TREM|nr:unnamed protein product [Schistosoma margrebowiei]